MDSWEPIELEHVPIPGTPRGDDPWVMPTPLTVVWRRWPFLLVGLLLGAGGGLAYVSTKPRVYESKAELLVIRKRPESKFSGDPRLNFVEDHLATLLKLIRSERMIAEAAEMVDPTGVDSPLVATAGGRAAAIASGLTVTRSNDTQASHGSMTEVLDMKLTSADPRVSEVLLAAVIRAFQNDLAAMYDTATTARVAELKSLTAALRKDRSDVVQQQEKQGDALRAITVEDAESIRGRISSSRDQLLALELKAVEIDRQLALIAKTGNDARHRMAVLRQLLPERRPDGQVTVESDDPAVALRKAMTKKTELSSRLGRDHPEMIAIDSEMQYLREFEALQSRYQASEGQYVDELTELDQRLKYEQSVFTEQIKKLRDFLEADRVTLANADKLRSELDRFAEQLQTIDATVRENEKQVTEQTLTQNSGGYVARVLQQPREGVPAKSTFNQSLALSAAAGLGFGFAVGFLLEIRSHNRTPGRAFPTKSIRRSHCDSDSS